MNATRRLAGLAALTALCLVLGSGASTYAQAAAGGQDQAAPKQQYTMAEYNAEQACAGEKVPATLIKCLDDFVSKYPNSNLLIYVYPLYYQAYGAQKNYAKVIEYADKLLALGDAKVDAPMRLQTYNVRLGAWTALSAADQAPGAAGARDAATKALKTLDEIKKPDNVSDADFTKSKQPYIIFFNNTGAQAAVLLKDYAGAMSFYKAVLAISPDDPPTHYNMSKAFLAMNPPQQMDAFWHVAKAVSSKSATDVQKKQLTPYLKKLILAYQGGTVCDSLSDSEYNELLQLASSTADRPDSYKLLSSADLDVARKDMTIASVIADLKAGGDKSKVTWFASCGLEFPDVPGKLLEVVAPAAETDPVVLKMAFVTSQAEFDAATAPDMEVKIVGQPEAGKLNKDETPTPRFTGTLMSYDPAPSFMLHWDKAKVNAEDLPKEKEKKPATKKPAPRRPAAKKPTS